MKQPLIGITADSEKPGGYSKFPWYALRQNYLDAIDAAGGLAVALPHEPDRVADYLERIDALVVTGGAFDVDPVLLRRRRAPRHGDHQGPPHRLRVRRHPRRAGQNKPVLGICGGQQLLHVVLGGKLIQHIPDDDCRAAGPRAAQPARRARPCREGRQGHAAPPHRRRRRAAGEQRAPSGGGRCSRRA
jgi:putative glutamine amidotransferase